MLLLLLRRVVLLIVLLLIVLLIGMLLARIIWLRLAWGERLAADVRLLAVTVVVALVGAAHLTGLLLLVIRLTLPELLLRRGDEAEIVLGMLIIIFRRDRIAGALRVTSELKVLFRDVGRGSANLYVRPVRENAGRCDELEFARLGAACDGRGRNPNPLQVDARIIGSLV